MMIRTAPRMAALAAALWLAGPLSAQEIASNAQAAPARGATTQPARTTALGAPARTLRAATATAIRVDGRLDEAAWATASVASDFTQQGPDEGKPATERTEARVLWDADAVYVAMRMYDTHPDSILGQLTRRDEESTSDGARVHRQLQRQAHRLRLRAQSQGREG